MQFQQGIGELWENGRFLKFKISGNFKRSIGQENFTEICEDMKIQEMSETWASVGVSNSFMPLASIYWHLQCARCIV